MPEVALSQVIGSPYFHSFHDSRRSDSCSFEDWLWVISCGWPYALHCGIGRDDCVTFRKSQTHDCNVGCLDSDVYQEGVSRRCTSEGEAVHVRRHLVEEDSYQVSSVNLRSPIISVTNLMPSGHNGSTSTTTFFSAHIPPVCLLLLDNVILQSIMSTCSRHLNSAEVQCVLRLFRSSYRSAA
ncbi:hypothetical protein BV25DRAFT_1508403 [Artomyces pyxidatus]|uniref:Uncharacterized protein n=1 Tax=Artomyces pyxidatus TaxID=48021 RepID=A0ACB8TC65_9AGAM|nr:hypothetical protein BV25DRAFT_1508403 [Artomyces pyxidatus]